MQVKPFSVPLSFGWNCVCWCDDFYEPEGVVYFDSTPKIGDEVELSDGLKWTITSVELYNNTIKVSRL